MQRAATAVRVLNLCVFMPPPPAIPLPLSTLATAYDYIQTVLNGSACVEGVRGARDITERSCAVEGAVCVRVCTPRGGGGGRRGQAGCSGWVRWRGKGKRVHPRLWSWHITSGAHEQVRGRARWNAFRTAALARLRSSLTKGCRGAALQRGWGASKRAQRRPPPSRALTRPPGVQKHAKGKGRGGRGGQHAASSPHRRLFWPPLLRVYCCHR